MEDENAPATLSPGERDVALAVVAWQNKENKPPGKVAKALRTVGSKASVVVPEKIGSGISKAIQGALEAMDDVADFGASTKLVSSFMKSGETPLVEPGDFAKLDLDTIEKGVAKLRKAQQGALAVEGAGTGFFGVAGMAADIPASLAMTFAAMKQVRIAYGFDPRTSIEKELLLAVLSESVEDDVEMGSKIVLNAEAKVLGRMAQRMTWKEMEKRAATNAAKYANEALIVAMRRAAQRLGVKFTHNSAGKLFPIIGAIASGAINYSYVRNLTNRMMMRSRQHYLERKYEADLPLLLN